MLIGSTFNFALTGGAAGTLVPPSLLDVAIDPGSWAKGVSLGAGAFLICDQSVSPVAMLRELMHFFEWSRAANARRAALALTRRASFLIGSLRESASKVTRARWQKLADVLQTASFCGLGQSTAIPMNSALTHFASAFETRSGQRS